MRRVLIVFASLLVAAFAVTADDHMRGYYGNRFEYIGYDGTKHIHINEDFTFEMLHHNNKIFRGTWGITSDKVCFTVPSAGETSCFVDLAGRKEGERWIGVHHTGNPYTGVIHTGRKPLTDIQGRSGQ